MTALTEIAVNFDTASYIIGVLVGVAGCVIVDVIQRWLIVKG